VTKHSLFSYSYDGDIFSIDPIHAPIDREAWNNFLKALNEFAFQRNGSGAKSPTGSAWSIRMGEC
jgi:hypothetical protein